MSKSTKKKTTKATKDTKSKKRKMKPGDARFVDEIPFKEITEEEAKATDECARPPMADAVVPRGRKLNPDKVRDIRARIAAGEKASDIAAVYDLHPSSVDDIRVGRTWSSVV